MSMRLQYSALVACLLLLLTACGSGSSNDSHDTTATAGTTSTIAESAASTDATTTGQFASTTQVASPSEPTSSSQAAAPATSQPAGDTPVSATSSSVDNATAGPLANYRDDRSGPVAVLQSLYNAINRHEYARAYSYWEESDSLPPFDQFQQGYDGTQSVELETGEVTIGAAAGNLYFSVPVALNVTTTDGGSQFFAGCYTLHLGQPQLQAAPPYHPIAIASGDIQQAESIAAAEQIMQQGCQPG